MSMNINIKALEITAETVKEFLQSVITPPLEQVGGLLADQIKLYRFKNQVDILQKATDYINAKGIKTHKVGLKTLVPLLEDCSLEEEGYLQDKWTSLFVNTVKEDSKIESYIFGRILREMSSRDCKIFEQCFGLDYNIQELLKQSKPKRLTAANHFFLDETMVDDFAIDNLVRERLLYEFTSETSTKPGYRITELGFRFMLAVSRNT